MRFSFHTLRAVVTHHVPIVLAWLLIAATVGLLASTYVGSASSPYDTCTLSDGRSVSCTALRSLSR